MFFSEYFPTTTYRWFNISIVNMGGYKCLHVQSRLIGGHYLVGHDSNHGSFA